MAKMYGMVKGTRGTASRCGSNQLETHAATWEGAVKVRLYIKNKVFMTRVELVPWSCVGVSKVLYDGPIGRYKPTRGKASGSPQ